MMSKGKKYPEDLIKWKINIRQTNRNLKILERTGKNLSKQLWL